MIEWRVRRNASSQRNVDRGIYRWNWGQTLPNFPSVTEITEILTQLLPSLSCSQSLSTLHRGRSKGAGLFDFAGPPESDAAPLWSDIPAIPFSLRETRTHAEEIVPPSKSKRPAPLVLLLADSDQDRAYDPCWLDAGETEIEPLETHAESLMIEAELVQ